MPIMRDIVKIIGRVTYKYRKHRLRDIYGSFKMFNQKYSIYNKTGKWVERYSEITVGL